MKAFTLSNTGPLPEYHGHEHDIGGEGIGQGEGRESFGFDYNLKDAEAGLILDRCLARAMRQRTLNALREYYGDPILSSTFYWITRKGERLLPKYMATNHLFYALRMMYNNCVAPVFRIDPENFIRYPDIRKWPTSYLQRAAEELLTEIDKRGNLESPLKEQLDDLILNADVIERLYPTT